VGVREEKSPEGRSSDKIKITFVFRSMERIGGERIWLTAELVAGILLGVLR
jgi:hypothetical protein